MTDLDRIRPAIAGLAVETLASRDGIAGCAARFRQFLVPGALPRIVDPARDGGNLLVAQVGELRHGRQLGRLRDAGAQQWTNHVGVPVAADEDRAPHVGGLSARRVVQAVAIGAPEQDVGLLAVLHDRVGQRRSQIVDVVPGPRRGLSQDGAGGHNHAAEPQQYGLVPSPHASARLQ